MILRLLILLAHALPGFDAPEPEEPFEAELWHERRRQLGLDAPDPDPGFVRRASLVRSLLRGFEPPSGRYRTQLARWVEQQRIVDHSRKDRNRHWAARWARVLSPLRNRIGLARTAALLLLVPSLVAHAAGPYYVSPTGSDAAAGTSTGAAWKTLQHAGDTIAAGDTVILMDGTHTSAANACWLTDNSGTNKWPANITVTCAAGATVIFEITARTGKQGGLTQSGVGSLFLLKEPPAGTTTIELGAGTRFELRDTGSQVPAYDSHAQIWDGVSGSNPQRPSAILVYSTGSATGNVVIDGLTITRYTGNGVNFENCKGEVHNADISGTSLGVRFGYGNTGGGIYDSHLHHNTLMGKDSPTSWGTAHGFDTSNDDFGAEAFTCWNGAANVTIQTVEMDHNYSNHSYDYGNDGGACDLYQAATNSNIRITDCDIHDNHGILETGTGSTTQGNGGWRFDHNRCYGTADQKFTIGQTATAPWVLLRANPGAEIDHNVFDVTTYAPNNAGFRFQTGGSFAGGLNNTSIHDNICRVRPVTSTGAAWASGATTGTPIYQFGALAIPTGTLIFNNLVHYTFQYTGNVFRSDPGSKVYTLDTGGAANSGVGLASAQAGTGLLAGEMWGDTNQTGPSRDPLFTDVTIPDYHIASATSPAVGTASDGGAIGAYTFTASATLKIITDSGVGSDSVFAGPTPFNSVLADDFQRTTAQTDGVFNPGTPFQGAPILGVISGISASYVNGNEFVHRINAAGNTTRYVYDGSSAKNVRIVKRFKLDALPAGASMELFWVARAATYDLSLYASHVFISTAGALTGNFVVRDGAGAQTGIGVAAAFPNSPPALTPGVWYVHIFECIGDTPTTLRMKVYRESDGEPAAWGITATDSAGPTTAGRVGSRFGALTSSTGLPRSFTEDTLAGVRVIATNPMQLQDTGAGTEALVLDQSQFFVITDSGIGSDGIDVQGTDQDSGLLVTQTITDAGVGADVATNTQGIVITDPGIGADAIPFRSAQITDAAVGTEEIFVTGFPDLDPLLLTREIWRGTVLGDGESITPPDGVIPVGTRLMANVRVYDSDGLWADLNTDPSVYGQIAATLELNATLAGSVSSAPPADAFNRTVVDGWGPTDTGSVWVLKGTAADFDVAGSVGTINLTAAGAQRMAWLPDVDLLAATASVKIKTDKLAVGGTDLLGLTFRMQDDSNYYFVCLALKTDRTVEIQVRKVTGGAAVVLQTAATTLTHTAGGFIWLKAAVGVFGASTGFSVKAWNDGSPEPGWSNIDLVDPTANLQTAGGLGIRAVLGSAATNAPVLVSVDSLTSSSP